MILVVEITIYSFLDFFYFYMETWTWDGCDCQTAIAGNKNPLNELLFQRSAFEDDI